MRISPALLIFALAACGSSASKSPTAEVSAAATEAATAAQAEGETFDEISPTETLKFTGTEPFWGGQVSGGTLTYNTPEDQDGTEIKVERLAGRGGISFSGKLKEQDLTMMVTPLSCSDGMSDRTYPFTVTLQLGEETRNGCGWTERQPFEGPPNP